MRSGFFNSEITGYDAQGLPQFDRAEDAEFLAKIYNTLFSNGIFPTPSTAFQVVQNEGMTVNVNPGSCMIQGYFAWEEMVRTLQVQASETLDRIDSVVLRLDLQGRRIDLFVRKGTASATPTPPELARPVTGQSADFYELGIANLFIAKNTGTITQDRINDTRLDSTRCGLVVQAIQTIDTSAYYEQANAYVEHIHTILQNALDEQLAGQVVNFMDKYPTQVLDYTLLASSWDTTQKRYLINDTRITSNSFQEYLPALDITQEQLEALSGANIQDGGQETGKAYLKAFGDVPTINIPIRILFRGEH